MKGKLLLSIWAAVAAFVINPYWACTPGPTTDEFQFGAGEMSKVVVGTWEGELTDNQGKKSSFTLVISRAKSQGKSNKPLLRTHCTTRSFLTAASACIQSTEMSLKGTFSTADGAYKDAALTGTFNVIGTKLENGDLSLQAQEGFTISASYNNGSFKDARLLKDKNTWTLTMKKKN